MDESVATDVSEEIKSPNLRAKLVTAMEQVYGVAKKGRNQQGQGYSYQMAADIFPKVQQALCAQNVAFLAHELSVEFPQPHETKSGGVMFVAIVKMRYSFYDGDSGEVLSGDGSGLGFDTSDKALNKAKTAALKYFLKQTFLIGEQEDDSERDTHEVKGAPRARAETPRRAAQAPKPESAAIPPEYAAPEAPVPEPDHEVITSDQAGALAKEIEDAGLNAEALLRSFAKTSKPAELTPAELTKVRAFMDKRRALTKGAKA